MLEDPDTQYNVVKYLLGVAYIEDVITFCSSGYWLLDVLRASGHILENEFPSELPYRLRYIYFYRLVRALLKGDAIFNNSFSVSSITSSSVHLSERNNTN